MPMKCLRNRRNACCINTMEGSTCQTQSKAAGCKDGQPRVHEISPRPNTSKQWWCLSFRRGFPSVMEPRLLRVRALCLTAAPRVAEEPRVGRWETPQTLRLPQVTHLFSSFWLGSSSTCCAVTSPRRCMQWGPDDVYPMLSVSLVPGRCVSKALRIQCMRPWTHLGRVLFVLAHAAIDKARIPSGLNQSAMCACVFVSLSLILLKRTTTLYSGLEVLSPHNAGRPCLTLSLAKTASKPADAMGVSPCMSYA